MDAIEHLGPDRRVLSHVFGLVLGPQLQQLTVTLH
jgi:hypothetical protein